MKLYINGDSHAAAAEAVNAHAFAQDDTRYFYLGRAPHPENLRVSWGRVLADTVKAVMHNDSESASSNQRIMRTTRAWAEKNRSWLSDVVMVIQWSTWERQEWIIDGQCYQINASGLDHVPATHHDAYKQFVSSVDWSAVTHQSHQDIWAFHQELQDLGVRHVFFNGNNHFEIIPSKQRHDWHNCYMDPYSAQGTYDSWLKSRGFTTVSPNSWHFGQSAHAAWAHNVLQYGITHGLWT
jgi:hypothetical protein